MIYIYIIYPLIVLFFDDCYTGRLLSNICGIVSCLFLFGTSVLLFLPAAYPIVWSGSNANMNWTFVVVFGFSVSSLVYWYTYAKTNFRGPTIGSLYCLGI